MEGVELPAVIRHPSLTIPRGTRDRCPLAPGHVEQASLAVAAVTALQHTPKLPLSFLPMVFVKTQALFISAIPFQVLVWVDP